MGYQERPFLGDALNRLQRMLGVTGSASPVYEDGSKIVPVVLVGDGTFPGYGAQQLRRFHFSITGANAVGQPTNTGILATKDVIITSFKLNWLVANVGLSLRYFGPNDTLPWAIGTPGGVAIDRALTGSEVSPLLGAYDNTGIAVAGSTLVHYEPQAAQVGLLVEMLSRPFLLMAGAAIIQRGTTANCRININIEGMAL